jgi:hypothetical protein
LNFKSQQWRQKYLNDIVIAKYFYFYFEDKNDSLVTKTFVCSRSA